jgi:hypothetical protein
VSTLSVLHSCNSKRGDTRKFSRPTTALFSSATPTAARATDWLARLALPFGEYSYQLPT